MPKLPSIPGKKAVETFEKAGFTVVRIAASHHIMKREGHDFVISVPVHGKKDLKPGTLRSLIRGAGMTVEEFVELLD